jgi:hypothetical protein
LTKNIILSEETIDSLFIEDFWMKYFNIFIFPVLISLSFQALGMLTVGFRDDEASGEHDSNSESSSEEYDVGWYEQKASNMFGKTIYEEYFQKDMPFAEITTYHIGYYDGKLSDVFQDKTYFEHLLITKRLYQESNPLCEEYTKRRDYVFATAQHLQNAENTGFIAYKIWIFLEHNRQVLGEKLSAKFKEKYEEILKDPICASKVNDLKLKFIVERAKQVVELDHIISRNLTELYLHRYTDIMPKDTRNLLLAHRKKKS